MRRAPAFTAVAVLTLAVGIGVNTTVATVTSAVLFKGFRLVERNDRILYIGTQNNGRGCCASYPDVLDWRAQSRSFADMAAAADLQIPPGRQRRGGALRRHADDHERLSAARPAADARP